MKLKFLQTVFIGLMLIIPISVSANLISLEVKDGRFCMDNNSDSDQLFNNGCGGPNYVYYADNRTLEGRRTRTSIEYDISSLQSDSISSATLKLYNIVSKDITLSGHHAPSSELLGYYGNGVVTQSDMIAGNVIQEFFPEEESFIELDVTQFISELINDSSSYAGFTFRIKNDFQQGIFANVFFAGELSSGSNMNPQWTPKLIITTVPEPSTLAIFALGIIGLASRRFNKQS
jgi:hypothetical protein